MDELHGENLRHRYVILSLYYAMPWSSGISPNRNINMKKEKEKEVKLGWWYIYKTREPHTDVELWTQGMKQNRSGRNTGFLSKCLYKVKTGSLSLIGYSKMAKDIVLR